MNRNSVIMEMLFPPQCLFCGEIKPFRQSCPDCAAKEEKLRLRGDNRLGYCAGSRNLTAVDAVVSCYIYTGEAADMIARYKFSRHYTMAREMAKLMAADILDFFPDGGCDVVLPVPAFGRGGLHSTLIAKRVAKLLRRDFSESLLKKIKDTRAQHALSFGERGANIAGAFSVAGSAKITGARVLLCDDVLTSGSTLNECAKALKEAGAGRVIAASFSATPAAG